MLDTHFFAGDGRVNENIALTTIHQIFHSEHDRLVDDIKTRLDRHDTVGAADVDALAAVAASGRPDVDADGWNGERLFQAARFVTEMEYQHLVFEEFARKVQPAVRPFHVYHPDINPAIPAEFAHAVYRFGHSMLDDDVARTNEDANGVKTDNSLPLLDGVPEPAGVLQRRDSARSRSRRSRRPARSSWARPTRSATSSTSSSPRRCATTCSACRSTCRRINMTRAREAGVPPLNNAAPADPRPDQRRPAGAVHRLVGLRPAPEAPGVADQLRRRLRHAPDHRDRADEHTDAGQRDGRREARRRTAIVDPLPTDTPPADAADFMFSTGALGNDADGVTTTGLDDVDLWVGGLAEVTNLFGGLLGSTFNYVFQSSWRTCRTATGSTT